MKFFDFFRLLFGKYQAYQETKPEFVEEFEYEKGFKEHYEKYLANHIQNFEQSRVEALQKARKKALIGFPLILFFFCINMFFLFFTGYNPKGGSDPISTFFIFLILAIIGWIYKSIKLHQKSIKSDIIPIIMSFFQGFKYRFDCDAEILTNLKNSDIIPNYHRMKNEDEFIGNYKNVDLRLFESELYIWYNKRYSKIFQGIVIELQMHKKFKGKTIVESNLNNQDVIDKLQKINLEDVEFAKIFDIYSSDQIEARYLLTTSFMQRLKNLCKIFSTKKINCSFYDEKLLITIELNKKLFEPGSILVSENFIDDSKKILKEMHEIFQIIDILKLDQNIGM